MNLRLALRLAALTPALVVGVPVQMLGVRFGWPLARHLPRWFHAYAARVFGIRVALEGQPLARGGVLLVANHISWMDILVLGAVLPVSFIARADMAGWPMFGGLARLQRSIFVDRERRHATGPVAEIIAARLAAGDAIVLFAEGTTSDGHRVLPFRSSLVGAARTEAEEGRPAVQVRPLALVYKRRSGLPLTRRQMPGIAWYGDMDLPPHLAGLLGGGPVDAVVSLGPALTLAHAGDRKRVAAETEAWIRRERRAVATRFENSAKRL